MHRQNKAAWKREVNAVQHSVYACLKVLSVLCGMLCMRTLQLLPTNAVDEKCKLLLQAGVGDASVGHHSSRVIAMVWLRNTGGILPCKRLPHLVSFVKCASHLPVGLDEVAMFCFSTPHPGLQLHITRVPLNKANCSVVDAMRSIAKSDKCAWRQQC